MGSPDALEEIDRMLDSSSPAGVGSPPEEGEMVVSPSPAGERLISSVVEGSVCAEEEVVAPENGLLCSQGVALAAPGEFLL